MKTQIFHTYSKLPLTPLFFGISFVSTMFLQNISQLYVSSFFLPLVAVIIAIALLTLLFAFLFGSIRKSELFLCLIVPLFFQYSTVVQKFGLFYVKIGPVSLARNSLVFPLFLLMFAIWFFVVWKKALNWGPFLSYLRVVALISVIFPLTQITLFVIKERLSAPIQSPLVLPKANTSISKQTLPDIYYIVPEDYAGSDVLKKSFHYDNTPFLSALQEKGFYVATQSASNYPKTFLSLASSLNLQYLDFVSDRVSSSDQTALDPIISNNDVMKYLRQYGYKYYQMGSWWQSTQYNDEADENYTLFPQTKTDTFNFLNILIEASLLHPLSQNILQPYSPYSSDSEKRDAIVYQLSEFPTVMKLDGPKFVFLHVIAPHGPYVFDRDCQPIGLEQTVSRYEEDNYIDQVNCINTKLLGLISTIQGKSKKPPVIILQTDEGAPFINGWLSPIDSWNSATEYHLKKKFPILSAFYYPGIDETNLYPTISPVNTFRVLFNDYFHTNFDILPDRSYIFPDLSHLYEFRDVTDRIR